MTAQRALRAASFLLAVGFSGACSRGGGLGGVREMAEPTTIPETVEAASAPEGQPAQAETLVEEGEPEGAVQVVCSRFSFSLHSMPHIGSHQVDEGRLQRRVNGLIDDVRTTAGEPLIQAFSSGGGSSFITVFSGATALAQCERTRASVAPPLSAGVTPRRRSGRTNATPCGPCAPEVLEAMHVVE